MTTTTAVPTHPSRALALTAVACVAVAGALAVGVALTEASTSTDRSGTPAVVEPAQLPADTQWRIGSPDALERSGSTAADAYRGDARYYGSPDAAERINGR